MSPKTISSEALHLSTVMTALSMVGDAVDRHDVHILALVAIIIVGPVTCMAYLNIFWLLPKWGKLLKTLQNKLRFRGLFDAADWHWSIRRPRDAVCMIFVSLFGMI